VLGVRAADLVCVLGVLGLDYAFKSFVSHAGPHELRPLLAPTATLVSCFTGHDFHLENGSGYVSRELFVVIAPACSGANFAIVGFTALALGFVSRLSTPLGKVTWLAASALLAYTTTILANAGRIALALACGHALAAGAQFTPEGAHRAIGVGVYLGCLLGLYGITSLAFTRRLDRTSHFALVPLGSYLAVTVITPLLNGSARGAFWSHALMVGGAAGSLLAVLWLGSRFVARVKKALGEWVDRTARPGGVRFGVDLAQRRRERSLSG
jgi:exosortase K